MPLLRSHTIQPPRRRRTAVRAAAVISGLALSATLIGCTGAAEPALPGNFPAAVEIADGSVLAAAQSDGVWTVNVKLDQGDTRQVALDELSGAGFAITGESGTHGNDRVYSLGNDEYSIRLGVTTVDGSDLLSYTVAKRDAAAQ